MWHTPRVYNINVYIIHPCIPAVYTVLYRYCRLIQRCHFTAGGMHTGTYRVQSDSTGTIVPVSSVSYDRTACKLLVDRRPYQESMHDIIRYRTLSGDRRSHTGLADWRSRHCPHHHNPISERDPGDLLSINSNFILFLKIVVVLYIISKYRLNAQNGSKKRNFGISLKFIRFSLKCGSYQHR